MTASRLMPRSLRALRRFRHGEAAGVALALGGEHGRAVGAVQQKGRLTLISGKIILASNIIGKRILMSAKADAPWRRLTARLRPRPRRARCASSAPRPCSTATMQPST